MQEASDPAVDGGVQIDAVWSHRVAAPRLPASWLSDEEIAAELQEVQRRRARDAAYEAELILALAADRPAALDPPAGSPGGRRRGWAGDEAYCGVSEFFTAELSAVLNLGRGTAAIRLARALVWRDSLPATFAALAAGEIDERRAQQLADVLMHTSREVAGQVEDALLGEAGGLSVYKLGARATELVLELDAAAADERRRQAERAADVRVHPSPTDGRSTLTADLATDEAAECYDLVDQLARMLQADGDPRPIGQLRAHVLSTLIRRPADSGLPQVCAEVTITAALDALAGRSTVPGEVSGVPITAGHVRELLARIGALGLTPPAGGSLTYAVTGPDGELRATVTPAELVRLAGRGCPAHSGEADCGCAVLGPPPGTDAYRPTDRQRAFVTTRDRRCRFPNCGQRVGWADLDHVIAHARGGDTDCTNLCCLCRSHHRLKTFAPGWRFQMSADGVLTVTTPSGVTRTTHPPGGRHHPPQPPPGPEPPPDDSPPFSYEAPPF
jgi:hypothetical protein